MRPQAQFLSPLRVEQIDSGNWKLTAPLRFYSAILGQLVEVPEGFQTDFQSVPRLPIIYWFTGNTAQAAGVVHDWFYRTNTEDITRAKADAVLAEAMEALGYWRVRSWFVWAGVRIGGYWSYDTRRAEVTK